MKPEIIELARSYPRETSVDCKNWLSFEVIGLTYSRIRFRYREKKTVDKGGQDDIESMPDNL